MSEDINSGIKKTEEMKENFQKDLKRRYSPLAFKYYFRVINECATFFDNDLTNLSYKGLREWHTHLLEKGLKQKTIKYKFAVMKAFLKYCVEENYIGDNCCAEYDNITVEKKLPLYLTGTELFKLREITKHDILYRTIIEVLFSTGLRISELINMELRDIDWEQKIIWIPSENSKNARETNVPFSATCEAWLKKYLKTRKSDISFVFVTKKGEKLCRYVIYHKFEYYGKMAGIPKKVGPHLLRKTCATYFAVKGANRPDIKRLLRHSDYWSQDYYVNLSKMAKNDF